MQDRIILPVFFGLLFGLASVLIAGGDEDQSAKKLETIEGKPGAPVDEESREQGQAALGDVPDDMRLVTVRAATSGKIQHGDYVDVYVTYISRLSAGKETVKTKHILADVEVFAVGKENKDDESSTSVKTVSLMLERKEVVILQLARKRGVISLTAFAEEESEEAANQ
jgi:Flp pilus assembly protein CpaB